MLYSCIDQLTDDILWKIVMFLDIDINQRSILLFISRKWKIFLNKSRFHNIFYRMLFMSPKKRYDELYFVGLSNCSSLRQLDLRCNHDMVNDQLSYLSNLTQLERLFLPCEITDSGLSHLTSLQNLDEIDVSYIRFNNDGLKYLSQLPKLTTLTLFSSRIRDESFKHISNIQTLTCLGISLCKKITDAGIKHLESLTNLDCLMMASMNITQFNFLSNLTNLKILDMHDLPELQDYSSFEILSSLTNLERLDLDQNFLNDDDLKFLPSLSNLNWLGLSHSLITDNGLQNLSQLTDLSKLSLTNCNNITGSGLYHIQNLQNLRNLLLKSNICLPSNFNIIFYNLIDLDLYSRSLSKSDMDFLPNFINLRSIAISGFDQEIPRLDSLRNLTSIVLNEFKCITDEFCLALSKLNNLDVLTLDHVTISDQNLYKLETCHFRKLELKACILSNAILGNIFDKMGQLEIFHLRDIDKITDDGLKDIGKLTRLQTFKIRECSQITMMGIQHLTVLTTLHHLCLDNLPLDYDKTVAMFPSNVNKTDFYY